MSDLPTRLRRGFGGLVPPICDEAANEIDRLNSLLSARADSNPEWKYATADDAFMPLDNRAKQMLNAGFLAGFNAARETE